MFESNTSGGSNLECLRLVNLDNILMKNMDPDLWVAAVSALHFFSLQVNMFNLNNEGSAEDSFGIEVQDIIEILVTVPGDRMDEIVGNDFGEERNFTFTPLASALKIVRRVTFNDLIRTFSRLSFWNNCLL